MRVNRTRTTIAAATVVALLGPLSACGGDAETKPTAEQASSTSPSEAAESPSEPGGEEVDGAALIEDMKAAVTGAGSAHLTMEMTGGAQGLSGEGDVSYAGDGTAMQMSLESPQLGGGTVDMRLVDGVIYLSMPPMTPKGKFFELDTTDPNSPFGDLGGMTAGDPLRSFEAFDAGLKEVRLVGEEEVDGETLRHYVFTVDATKAAKAQGTPLQPGMPDEVTYDLWLDGDDLMRRIEFTQGGGTLRLTMSDWGKDVDVAAPPKSAIMQLPDFPSS